MSPDATWLRETLVAWYAASARRLPWRDDPTPYRVLMSEFMLQQTRVETVLPYFRAFVARWPTIEDLAAAREEDVLTAWAGLGYYRRARALHAAARAAVASGGLRGEVDALRALPGVGPYTAGAVASIAYGVPAPAIDGNVERVISRVDGRQEDPRSPAGRRALEARVRALTAPGVASQVTQGLMELGALVCVPRTPRCAACPWEARCVARAQGLVADLPRVAPRRAALAVHGVAGVLRGEGRVLLARRPPGLLGGLWEPPGGPCEAGDDREAVLREAWRIRLGRDPRGLTHRGEVTHVFTHRHLTLTVFEVGGDAPCGGGDGSYEEVGWFDEAAPGVGLSRLAQKVLAVVRDPAPGGHRGSCGRRPQAGRSGGC